MRTVHHLLKKKGSQVWSVRQDQSVFDALKVMAEKNIGALVVLTGERCDGIISERDYARKVILKGKSSKKLPVSEIMTSDPICIDPDRTVRDCMALMTERRIRHLPVIKEGHLIGLVSIGDVVKDIIEDQSETINLLEGFIKGTP
jgi:CBS domain-containing protein